MASTSVFSVPPNPVPSSYYNYKQFYSLVLQGVADARCRFLTIDVGAMGKQSDGGAFSSSDLFKCLESNAFKLPESMPLPSTNIETPLMLIGDEGYPLLPYLMRSCAFGIMASKFCILRSPIETQVECAERVVKACRILHNVIIDKEGTDYDLINETSTSSINPLLLQESANLKI